ncbi:MAG: RNA-binding S4 domain-containing protein [Dysgonamonadaceae bacterium]|jgi:ribosome-associated heat shock protein Hsp15|nr:RNA-binding S4 domain-containing protein [Dysgonamonadaceae bacterium]
MQEVRIDKWLWAMRIFKTRTIALEECKKNRITVNGSEVKPSRTVKIGDTVTVRKPPITYSFRVLNLSQNRLGAKLVPEYLENITPSEEYEILEMSKISGFVDRARGSGRPTKKERRDLDRFSEDTFDD